MDCHKKDFSLPLPLRSWNGYNAVKTMKTKLVVTPLLVIGLAMATLALGLVYPAYAAGSGDHALQMTPFPTPTPRADGQIIYVVQEGDSLWRIAALAEITIEELMALNGIQPEDFISPGMELLLGFAGPTEPTAITETEVEAQASPTPAETPVYDTGDICVLLFIDENGNARLDEGELPLAGGQVSVVEASGVLLGDHTTDTTEDGHCFSDLVHGEYNVSAAVPSDYIPTTVMNLPVSLAPGDVAYVQFGAQANSSIVSVTDDGGGNSLLLGLIGLVFLLGAGGLGFYAARMSRNSPRSLR